MIYGESMMNIKKNWQKLSFFTLLMSTQASFAIDYEVAGGTFFMQGSISATVTQILPDEKGTNEFGIFTEGSFVGSAFSEVTSDPNFGITTASIDDTATRNGLAPFIFFGVPVHTYFAPNGVDNDGIPFIVASTGEVFEDLSTDPHPGITIDLENGIADISSMYVYWNGTEFNQGNATAAINDNGDGTYTLSWSSLIIGGSMHGNIGDWTMTICPATCPIFDDAPAGKLSVTQGGPVTRTLVETGADFLVSSSIDDAIFTFNWGASSSELTSRLSFGTSTSDTQLSIDMTTFSPVPLTAGAYEVQLVAINNNTDPKQKSISTMQVSVVNSYDGLDLDDADNDGIPNEYDVLADNTQLKILEENSSTFLMQASKGSFSPGFIGVCNRTFVASVSFDDITNMAGPDCSNVINGIDATNTVITGLGDRYYDFIIDEFNSGDTVDIIIPLNVEIPQNSGWRQFTRKAGWQSYISEGNDMTSSATATSDGVCPSADSTSWSTGLTKGDNCIKLSIVDGGPNDEDGAANGTLKQTGALSNWPGLEDSNTEISVGSIFWLLISSISILSFRRKLLKT